MRPASLLVLLALLGAWPLPAQASLEAPIDSPLGISLEEAQALARSRADAVKARTAGLASAQAALQAAKASGLPKVSASASGAWLANPPSGVTIPAGAFGQLPPALGSTLLPSSRVTVYPDAKASYFKGNLSLTQPLVTWGKIKAGIDLASLEVEAALLEAESSQRSSGTQAASAYWAAKASLEAQGILAELEALAGAVIADKEAALNEGMITKAELLQARVDLADIQSRRVEAREAGLSALGALAILMDRDPGQALYPTTAWAESLPPLDEPSFVSRAMEASPGQGSASVRLKEAGRKLVLEEASSPFRPDLGLFASLDASGQTPPLSVPSWWDSTWTWDLSLGVSMSLNVYDGGRARARIAQAQADEAAARAALGGASHEAWLAARRAIEAAHRAEAGLAKARARADWSAEVLKNARLGAESELVSRQDLNRAAMQEAGTRLDLVEAHYALEEAISSLDSLVPGYAK